MNTPYYRRPQSQWLSITQDLIDKHPLKNKIVEVVLKSWEDIFLSNIGSYSIGKEIFPSPQIMSFFLHELVAHNLSLLYPEIYKVGVLKNEKDIHVSLILKWVLRLRLRQILLRYLRIEAMPNLLLVTN